MNKEEMVNKYQELLKEYQEAEISRRKSIEEEKKLKEQKDIAEQKIEFEEAKERFESDANLSTEEIIAKAKLRQDELNKIEEARLNTQKNVKDLENKKQEIRKSAEEYNRNNDSSLQNKLEELTNMKNEKVEEIEAKRREIKLQAWTSKDESYKTNEEYIKLENELKASMQDLRKIENDIGKETERLDKYGKQEQRGIEVAYKAFINGADRIDQGKFTEFKKEQAEAENKEVKKETKTPEKVEESTKNSEKTPDEKNSSENDKKEPERIEKNPDGMEPPTIIEPEEKQLPAIIEQKEDEKGNLTEGKKEDQKPLNNDDKTQKEEAQKGAKQGEGKKIADDQNKENIDNNAVRIIYNAKKDEYIVTNVNTGKESSISRKNIEKQDKNLLEQKMGKDLRNVDMNVLQVLRAYDKEYKTNKTSEYVESLSTLGKNEKERLQEMEDNEIDIVYNLKGLYDKHQVEYDKYESNFKKEEIKELLEIANNANKKGIATVEKGVKVSLLELRDKIISKISKIKLPTTKKLLALPQANNQKKKQAKEVDVKKAKSKTRTDATVESEKSDKSKMKNIREEMNSNIPLEQQRDYSIKKQKEFEEEAKEKPEKDVIYLDIDNI